MAKKKKRRVKLKKILTIILILIAIIIFVHMLNNKKQPEAKEIEIIDTIDDFGYQLNDNETEYYKKLFNELKDLLNQEDYNEEEYAQIISKLFLTDFYDLNSKIMKSDIGGTQFVYEPYQQDFELGAKNSIYKYVESNIYGDRKQDLPIVKEVTVETITKDTFEYNNEIDYNAYYLTMNISYNKNLGYPTNVELVLIHDNDRLEIAKLETKI